MPTISPYTQGLVIPNYAGTDYDSSLEFQILAKKQQDYNTILNRLDNLQTTSLNISMLNQPGQVKLDQYNKELNSMLSSNLGDLTDSKVQSKVASMFTKIATDADLKRRSQLSRFYQDQLSVIDQMQKSKDPTKSGYNPINDYVFRNWEGGLNDFAYADNISGWEQKQQRYVPYKDIDQKLVNLTKLLHAESETIVAPKQGSPGYSFTESEKGVSKNKIRTLLETTLDQDELSQMEILAKYRILQQNSPEGKLQLYHSYNTWITKEKANIQNQLERARAYKNQYDPSKVDSKLPKEEREQKKNEYRALQEYYGKEEETLKQNLIKSEQANITINEWNNYSPSQMLSYVNQMIVEDYVNNVSEALSWKERINKVDADDTYFANRRLNVMEQRLQLDAQLGTARIELEKYKIAKDNDVSSKGSAYSNPADIFKSPESVISSWEDFVAVEKQYSNKTSPVITSEGFKPEQLTNNQWLQQNKDNYEVRLWNAFESKFYDDAFTDSNRKKPNIESFKAFKAQVLNGDYKKDPLINQITQDFSRDADISNYYTELAKESANAINQVTDMANIRKPGGNSLGDYAIKNGWDGKGEMTFGLPSPKGGFTQMTLTELQNEYKRRKPDWKESIYLGLLDASTLGTTLHTGLGSLIKDSIFSEDPELFDLVGMSLDKQEKNKQIIQEVLTQKLPQQFQGKQMIALDEDTRTRSIGDINSAIKLSSEDNPVSIDANEITNVSIPYGIGNYGGFSISEKEAERLKSAGAKIVTVGGELHTPKANVWYKVPMHPTNSYDVVYNDIFEKKGIVKKVIEGHNVQITSVRDSDYMTINIDGETQVVPRRDITQTLGEIERGISLFEQSKQQPK